MTYPRPLGNGKMLAKPMIKKHQLETCRKHNGGFLIYDNETEAYYWLTPKELDRLIIGHGLVKSLKGHIDHLTIDPIQFIQQLKQ